jgi:hypothetical protein
MARIRATNPFYVVLLAVSVLFVVTVCGYTLLTFRTIKSAAGKQEPQEHGLLTFMDRHGVSLMLAEVALLAVTTVGAISTDQYWAKRGFRRAEEEMGQSRQPR